MIFFFYLLAAVAVFSALMVVFSRSPINSVIFLIICFLSLAGHYILLNAQFLAIVHVIVYTGAIMVLFLFVIMLLNLNSARIPRKSSLIRVAAVVSGGLLFLVMLAAFKDVATVQPKHSFDSGIGLVHQAGMVLYKEFLFPFEITALLFISAMVGAVLLGRKDHKSS